jgi:predicted GIY-YIG superfamily endonuclease
MKKDNPLKTVTAKKIIKEIETYVFENSTLYVEYSNWYCGITNNPNARKSGHKTNNNKTPALWKHFNARSVKISLKIETYFHKKGMLDTDDKGGYDKDNSKFIYIYKKHPTILD